MFAMFGASVLVPFMFGINPAIVLLMNGIGTLLFILITKGKAPAYLGSSFAFLSPGLLVASKFGFQYALGGFVVLGICGMIVALIIRQCGTNWIDIVLPTAAMGPVVALIGLELAGSAASTAGLLDEQIDMKNVIVFLVTLGVAVFGQILFRGFLSVIPILIAIIAGYAAAAACGILDFTAVKEAAFFALPNFQAPKFNLEAILTILPALLLVTSEHIGHQIVTSKIVGKDLLKDPGLEKTLLGDGIGSIAGAIFGGCPNTTYGESVGCVAITGNASVSTIGLTAIMAILLSFFTPFVAFVNTIPSCVVGGICIALYGFIAVSGLKMLHEVDLGESENLFVVSAILVTGIGGLSLNFGGVVEIPNIATALIIGVLTKLIVGKVKSNKSAGKN